MNIGELAKFRGGIATDTISEVTSASGVTIDSVLCKDGEVTASGTSGIITNTITERTAAAGVTIDETLLKDGGVTLKTGSEIQDAGGKYVKIKGGDGSGAVAAGYVGYHSASTATVSGAITANTSTVITTLTVNKGIYLCIGSVYLRASSTAVDEGQISTGTSVTGSAGSGGYGRKQASIDGDIVTIPSIVLIISSDSTAINLLGRSSQNSTTGGFSGTLSVVKIA